MVGGVPTDSRPSRFGDRSYINLDGASAIENPMRYRKRAAVVRNLDIRNLGHPLP